MRTFTVILLYPAKVATHYGDCFYTALRAKNRPEAAKIARERAIHEWNSCKTDGHEHIELHEADLKLLALFDGNLLAYDYLQLRYRPRLEDDE